MYVDVITKIESGQSDATIQESLRNYVVFVTETA